MFRRKNKNKNPVNITSQKLTKSNKTQKKNKKRNGQLDIARENIAIAQGTSVHFRHDLLALYAQNQRSIPTALPFICTIFAVISLIWVPITFVGLWLASVYISHGILLTMCKRFLMTNPAKSRPSVWEDRFSIAEFFCGLTIAGAALFMLVGDVSAQYSGNFIEAVVFGFVILIMSLRMILANNSLTMMYSSSLPVSISAVAIYSYEWQISNLVFIGLIIMAQYYYSAYTRRQFKTSLAMLSFRAEKEALFGELEQSKIISDEARKRAEESNIAKSRFLATMSHELRTPLNAIIGFSEVMKDEMFGAHGNPVYKEYSGDIHKSGEHLLELINDILDLSRIEAGRYTLQEEVVDISKAIEKSIRLVELRANEKGIQIVRKIQQDIPNLWVDAKAFHQILLNLLSNASKFTPQNGNITVYAWIDKLDGLSVAVRDDGPGIPKDEIPHILSQFGQGSLAHETAAEGAGLGLPIIRGLVEMHEGKFSLQSELGQGTVVTVHMPKDRVVKPQAANEVTAESENSQNAERKHAEQKRAAFLQMQADSERKNKNSQSA
ncbi:MAG: HAMP domain-containing histidine kinase [OCS116 cluster bacterium]|uniref:histidine kinase n=1 Tax=OCS116 cluster bacterium TaxID=2030921 RepID=A0A2A4Z9X7_9PROT|nr:HAMP domain-containing histidine kinase [OCS116 cluster bacterium]